MSEQIAERDERVEWRVETDQTEDDFGTDEEGARDWLARCEDNPGWLPAVLMRRTVVTEATKWTPAAEPTETDQPEEGE